jgi:hypothetical protein
MRLKLVFICSILAALIGSGASIGVVLAIFSSLQPMSSPDLLVIAALLLPLITCLVATIFVYRHTARRRKLQALLTAIMSILLSLAILIIASVVTARLKPLQPPLQEPRTIA